MSVRTAVSLAISPPTCPPRPSARTKSAPLRSRSPTSSGTEDPMRSSFVRRGPHSETPADSISITVDGPWRVDATGPDEKAPPRRDVQTLLLVRSGPWHERLSRRLAAAAAQDVRDAHDAPDPGEAERDE